LEGLIPFCAKCALLLPYRHRAGWRRSCCSMPMKLIHRLIGSLIAAAALAGAAHAQNVRILGRSDPVPTGGFAIQWPSSGFEATFDGPTLKATIFDWGSNWLNVEIDGKTSPLALEEGSRTYTLFDGAPGRHTIRVTRRTASNVGITRFENVEAAGLHPTSAPDHRIMVIGDSFASGFGVEGVNEKCAYSHQTQNADLAFPALLGRTFGADIHVIATDGRGLIRNWTGEDPTMSTLAWQTLPDGATSWTPQSYKAQVIVVNLGTNDFTASDPGESFDAAYVFMLRRLRATYPDALIVGSIGGSLWGKRFAAARTSISDAIDLVRKEGDANVRFVEFKLRSGPGRYGCDYHPGQRAQIEMAAALEQEISNSLGWTTTNRAAD